MKTTRLKSKAVVLTEVIAICTGFRHLTSKFGESCYDFVETNSDSLKEVRKKIARKKRELASVDDKGNLLYDDKTKDYFMTPANMNKFEDFVEKTMQEEVDFEPVITEDIELIKEDNFIRRKLKGFIHLQ